MLGESLFLEIEVANVAERKASEGVQVYVHDDECRLPRPEQELRAFEKVELDPGSSQVVRFELDARAMSYYDPDSSEWTVDPGAFEVRVGASSRDIRLQSRFDVTRD